VAVPGEVKFRIIIYESSSFGGCYQYALELINAYGNSPDVGETQLLLPSNAVAKGPGVLNILLNDKKAGKLSFIVRQIRNPFILFSYLIKQKPSFVLLNDFEQISAPLWALFFRLFLKKHRFGVFLHDADRDDYPPSLAVSAFCMKQIMKTVSVALFHGTLPERSYYKPRKGLTFLSVRHGPYYLPAPDGNLFQELKEKTSGFSKVLSIPGNIRTEKNYQLVIEALRFFPDYCLLIAGNPANSGVDTNYYKSLSRDTGVEKQIIWIEKYLSDEELAAVISISEVIVLYYAASFHSQSGILHQVIPMKKPVLVSELPNALTEIVNEYGLGYICKPDNLNALKDGLSSISLNPVNPDWEKCMREMGWGRQVEETLKYLQNVQK